MINQAEFSSTSAVSYIPSIGKNNIRERDMKCRVKKDGCFPKNWIYQIGFLILFHFIHFFFLASLAVGFAVQPFSVVRTLIVYNYEPLPPKASTDFLGKPVLKLPNVFTYCMVIL